jgi:hypothetical protein
MLPLLAFAAKEAATSLLSYFARGVKVWLTHKAKEWLGDLIDLAVSKLTGRTFSQWEQSTKDLLSAAVGLEITKSSSKDLAALIMSKVLRTPEGDFFVAKWKRQMSSDSGETERQVEWEVDYSPIPRETDIYSWAKSVASKLGLTEQYVLARRFGI